MSETVLWTNSSPTSGFNAQTVTLNQSINNFKYIKLTYCAGYQNSNKLEVIWPVSSVKKMKDAELLWGAIAGVNSTGKYGRYITYVSDTKLSFSNGLNYGGAGNSNAPCIPLSIKGLK